MPKSAKRTILDRLEEIRGTMKELGWHGNPVDISNIWDLYIDELSKDTVQELIELKMVYDINCDLLEKISPFPPHLAAGLFLQ